MPAEIAVAVVSWNTRELLDRCLCSLRGDSDAGRAEVWVVDNASIDGSADLVREDHPWAQLIASPDNLGFGPAVNLVGARTNTPWLAPANADVELTPGALETLLRAGTEGARVGAVAPRLVLADGSTQQSVHAFPTLPFTLLFNLGVQRLSAGLGDRMCVEGRWDPDRRRDVDWALGAFLAVRREAFDQAGGFDPAQWMYAEDLDLAWRLRRAGWRTRYEPAAVVRHAGSAAARQAFGDAVTRRWMHSTYDWMRRRRGPARTRAVAAVNVAGAVARYALLSPTAPFDARRRATRAQMREWAALHAAAGLRRPQRSSSSRYSAS